MEAIREQYHQNISDLADELMDKAMARGEAFTEALCNWAISQAEQTIPKPEGV